MINLQAINPRISANFPVKLAGTNPKVGGGHRGLPLSEGGGRIQPREGCLAGQPREPRAPWHPLWGGEIQPRGGPWPPSGREINGYPFTTFTDFSDFLGIIPRVYVRILVRLHRFYRFLLVNIVDRFLPIACRRLQSSILSKTRPPEELLHQTCGAFRAESDSSALEVPGGLLVVVFEASRPNTGICRANN